MVDDAELEVGGVGQPPGGLADRCVGADDGHRCGHQFGGGQRRGLAPGAAGSRAAEDWYCVGSAVELEVGQQVGLGYRAEWAGLGVDDRHGIRVTGKEGIDYVLELGIGSHGDRRTGHHRGDDGLTHGTLAPRIELID